MSTEGSEAGSVAKLESLAIEDKVLIWKSHSLSRSTIFLNRVGMGYLLLCRWKREIIATEIEREREKLSEVADRTSAKRGDENSCLLGL